MSETKNFEKKAFALYTFYRKKINTNCINSFYTKIISLVITINTHLAIDYTVVSFSKSYVKK